MRGGTKASSTRRVARLLDPEAREDPGQLHVLDRRLPELLPLRVGLRVGLHQAPAAPAGSLRTEVEAPWVTSSHSLSNCGSPARTGRAFSARRNARVISSASMSRWISGSASRRAQRSWAPRRQAQVPRADEGGERAGRDRRPTPVAGRGRGRRARLAREAGLELRQQRLGRGIAGVGVLLEAPLDEPLERWVHLRRAGCAPVEACPSGSRRGATSRSHPRTAVVPVSIS